MSDNKPKNLKWWTLKDKDNKGNQLASTIFYIVDQITKSQTKYWKANFLFAQMYENIDSLVTSTTYPLFQNFGMTTINQSFNSKLTFNVIKSCVDSVTSKIAKNKPRVKFVTSGGDFKIRRKALNLTKYIDGVFYESDVYTVAAKVFKDACIFGTGCLKISYNEFSEKFEFDRVIVPLEMVIDNAEAQYGKPRQIHQRKLISKDILLSLYPDKEASINGAETAPNVAQYSDDRVLVIESWKLPSYVGAKDGKHCITINSTTLVDEEYNKDYFPFIFINWTDRVHGFYGYGLTEELTIMQLIINKTHKMIQAGMAINSVPRVFATAGSIVNKNALYDAGVIELKPGSPQPVFNTSAAASGDIYAYLENMVNKSYQMTGVSQLQASSQKPAGLDSGAALREFNDQNSERFAIQSQNYENMFLNIAKIVIDLSKDEHKSNKNLSVKGMTPNQKFCKIIKFADVNLEDEDYIMQCFPVSKLPNTPEGRLAFIKDLAQAGAISQSQMTELLEMPDLENWFSLKNATFDVVCNDLDKIVEDEEYNDPDPQLDLNLAAELTQAYYLKSKISGVSEYGLTLLRQYRDAIIDLQNQAQPPQQPQSNQPQDQSQAAGGQMGVPAAPPVSELLPVNQ